MTALRKRILVIDDSRLILEIMGHALEQAGFSVTCVAGLTELDRVPTVETFDLILCDVEMPEAFGDDLTAMLRHHRGITTPMLLVSTLPPKELAARATEAGVDGWILKQDGIGAVVAGARRLLGEHADEGE